MVSTGDRIAHNSFYTIIILARWLCVTTIEPIGDRDCVLTQVIRLAIAERILLISGNVDRRDQREPRRDQRLQSRGHRIRGMEEIVHLIDQRPGYEAVLIAGRGDLPVSQNQRERTAERKEVARLEVQLVVMRIVTVNR